MKEKNKLLLRQMLKFLGPNKKLPVGCDAFLNAISDSYDHFERDRSLLERSIEISSEEMVELNVRLREETHKAKTAHTELEKLLKNVNDTVFTIEFPSRELRYISPGCEEIYGYPPSAFFTNPNLWYDLILEEDRVVIDNNFPLMDSGLSFLQVYRIKRKDGEIRWLESKITPTLSSDNVITRIDGITADVTERELAGQELKRSERRLLASQRISKIGSVELGLTKAESSSPGNMVWSVETYRIFGYEPYSVSVNEDIFYKHISPEDVEKVHLFMTNAVKTRTPLKLEYRIITAHGSEKLVSSMGEFEYSETTKAAVRFVGTIQDMTESIELQKALISAKANLSNILENTDTSYFLLNKDLKVVMFNNLARKVVFETNGMELKTGVNYINCITNDRQAVVREMLQEVLSNRKKIEYEVKHNRDEQSDMHLLCKIHPVINSNRELSGISVSATDITNSKTTELQLKLSNERYELVRKATQDVIWDWDIINDVMFRSDNYSEFIGLDDGPNNGDLNTWLERVHPDDRERILANVNQSINDQTCMLWEDEYRYLNAQGDVQFIFDRAYLLRDENGKTIRMVGAMRNITPQKMAEIERQEVTLELVKQNKDLEQFAYIISHNLRAPVANIIGFTQMLSSEEISEDENKQLTLLLNQAVKNLDNIISDINEILKVKRDDVLNREMVNINTVISDICLSIKNLIDQEQVIIDLKSDEANEIYTVKSYFYSILYNLISNSIKYRKPGERPRIKIVTAKQESGITLFYKDDGMGIDLEKNGDKVFGLYRRFHNGIEGKGMGLFMVKSQVDSMKGTITLKSEVNKGVEFTINIKNES